AHSSTGFYCGRILLTVSATPTLPGVRPLNHPAFLQGWKALRADWPRRHCDVPAWTMLSPPGRQSLMVLLLIRNNRAATRTMGGGDAAEPERGRHPISKTGTGNEHGQHPAQRIDQQMPLTPRDLLATIVPPLRAAHRGGLDRLTLTA